MLFTRSRLSDEEKMAAAAYYYRQKAEKKAANETNKEKTKKAKDKKKGEVIFHDFSEESKKAETVYDKLQKAAEEEAAEIAAQKAAEADEPKAEEAAEHEKEKPKEKKEHTEPKAEEAEKPAEKPVHDEKKEGAIEPAEAEAPVEPADAEKAEEPEPEVINPDAMKAAPEAGFNTGFKIDNFVQKTLPKPTPQQVTPAQVVGNLIQQPPQMPQQQPIPPVQTQPVTVGGTPIVPSTGTPSEKCDAIRASILASVGITPVYDPKPDLTPKQKLNLIKKNISFMTGEKRQLDVIQLCGLIGLIEAPILKIRMEEYGAVDRTNNPKLVEVPIESQEVQQGYDMKFSVKLKNKAETMFVLFSSVPDYNDTLKSWNHAIQIYKK